ncbi:MAG TPA: ABC transporter ATP-binding protein [Alphaproteobacteria bacterium]|nr:ABC transporter ATP-binding protein [Alphaproteobacteria bacterium]
MSLLAAENLTVRLGSRNVLTEVDFAIPRGKLIGLIGPNGAGKTTLLRTLAGLERPRVGRVTFDGVALGALNSTERARRLAYLSQGGDLHWPLSVARVVALGRLPHLEPWQQLKPADYAAIEAAMADCEITHLADRPAGRLSGGERARVMLARALAAEPDLLLADEPVAGLDPYHQLHVMELLAALARRGAGVVVVLHDLGLAARFCDRLALLAEGRMAALGTPDEVLQPDLLERVYGVRMAVAAVDGQLLPIPWSRPSSAEAPP